MWRTITATASTVTGLMAGMAAYVASQNARPPIINTDRATFRLKRLHDRDLTRPIRYELMLAKFEVLPQLGQLDETSICTGLATDNGLSDTLSV